MNIKALQVAAYKYLKLYLKKKFRQSYVGEINVF